ncbi:erythromycin esterase family protein [Hymenobacter sp. BT683]|uniref:Erythromycin esterase family protein n=1 Tax=Hymenobacter jeongseonensis TaxID=2791027 RepID=A0ABS0II43_9BACT|nr:erythromycin esterase family protein [Hymenobacter jeongseonensis]MBF9238034.1 erythromycin esterase family protein [Hymenobacter jeongseonensis]
MKSTFRTLLAAALLTAPAAAAFAQTVPTAATDTARIVLDASVVNSVNTQSYFLFRQAVRPLIEQMGDKKVVALGEGTHGTAEFYKLRFWLTRILMEDKGFTQVALENSYGDCYRLNQALHSATLDDLKPLMKKHLLSIWQNRETEEMLNWMHTYNTSHLRKVELAGIDAMYGTAAAELLRETLAHSTPEIVALTQQLVQQTTLQAQIWTNLNDRSIPFKRPEMMANGWAGYETTEQLAQALKKVKLPKKQRAAVAGAVQSLQLHFDTFYQPKVNKRESSRDSVMAEMTKFLVRGKGSKVIIWAHNAHVSRSLPVPGDNNGGGTGKFLERAFPGQYFVLGTSTATGTVAATTHRFITTASPMAAYPLDAPVAGSWEQAFNLVTPATFYVNTRQLTAAGQKHPHRLVGYSPQSGADSYYPLALSRAYDALLFVRQTTAATPL